MSKKEDNKEGHQPETTPDTSKPPQGTKPKRKVRVKVKSRGKGSKPRRTLKTKLSLSKKICDKYAEGIETIESICNNYDVPYSTFNDWATEGNRGYIVEVAVLYKEAVDSSEANYGKALKNKAKESLLKKVTYVEVEEVHLEKKLDNDGNTIGQTIKKVTKTLAPTDSAIIFALTNKDSDNFKNKHSVEANVKVKVKLDDMEDWTTEELLAEIARCEKIVKTANKSKKSN